MYHVGNHGQKSRFTVPLARRLKCLTEFPIRIDWTDPVEFRGCWVVSFNFITILKSTFCKQTVQSRSGSALFVETLDVTFDNCSVFYQCLVHECILESATGELRWRGFGHHKNKHFPPNVDICKDFRWRCKDEILPDDMSSPRSVVC